MLSLLYYGKGLKAVVCFFHWSAVKIVGEKNTVLHSFLAQLPDHLFPQQVVKTIIKLSVCNVIKAME